jgi:hypothetical protein
VQVPIAPTTEYVVGFVVGYTIANCVVTLPAFALHVNDVAVPPASKPALLPEQTVGVGEFIKTIGDELTVTTTFFTSVQPRLSPVTTYVCVEPGETEIVLLTMLPGIQVNVCAPLAVKVVVAPAQIVAGEALAVTVGVGLTLMVIVVESIQPPVVPVTE